jgi:tRNA(fMet)-specific endonuclease VapC
MAASAKTNPAADVILVDINRPEILTAYAEIDYLCEKVLKPARPMSKNDLWIAATACVLQCTLVTTDADFDHLHGKQRTRRWIDPASLRPAPQARPPSP